MDKIKLFTIVSVVFLLGTCTLVFLMQANRIHYRQTNMIHNQAGETMDMRGMIIVLLERRDIPIGTDKNMIYYVTQAPGTWMD